MSKSQTKQRATDLSVKDNGLAILTIDTPGKLNVLSPPVFEELDSRFDEIAADNRVTAVVIKSGKPGSFVAGADIKFLNTITTTEEGAEMSRAAQGVFNKLEDLKVPVVCAIDGVCLGGGLEMALACHYRLVSENPATVLGLPEVQIGLIPGAGGTQRLPRLIGFTESLDKILTGKKTRAKKALKLGLADELVPVELIHSRAEEAALELAGKSGMAWKNQEGRQKALTTKLAEAYGVRSAIYTKAKADLKEKTRGHYPAPMLALEAVRSALRTELNEGLEEEAKHFGEAAVTSVSKSLIHLFNITTELKGDSGIDGEAEAKDVTNAAVIGGGLMGSGITTVLTDVGVRTRVKDISEETLGKMYGYVDKYLKRKVKRKHYRPFERDVRLGRVTASTDYSGFKNAQIAIEAVFEDINLKHKVVGEIEENLPADTIFASNTSSLPIAKIAEGAKNPELVIGMHFFSPVEKMQLVEVITHDGTADWVTATTVALAKKMKKHTIVVRDGAGFYTSRILAAMCNEAVRCLYDGAPIEKIDKALEYIGFPVGPMRLMDEVGIGVVTKVMGIMMDAFPGRFEAPPQWENVLEGRQGKSSGLGFYRYTNKGRSPDRSVYRALPNPERADMRGANISERCLYAFLNECAHCLQEGILRCPRDGDVGAVFGLGYPPFEGGPFFHMDSIGLDKVVENMERLATEHGERFQPAQILRDMAKKGETFFS